MTNRIAPKGTFQSWVDSVVGDLDLSGGDATLDGGADHDDLIGDVQLRVVAAIAGPLFAGMPGTPAPGASGWGSSHHDAPVTFDGLVDDVSIDRLTLDADREQLDGGAGGDSLHGDQVFVLTGAVDASGDASLPAGTGTGTGVLAVDIDVLVDRIDIRADRDTLLGGDDDDQLTGDNDTSVRVHAGASTVPQANFGMTRLVDYLKVGAGHDDSQGEAGNDAITSGNRAEAGAPLVKKTRISSKAGNSAPVPPVIDWAVVPVPTAGGPAAGASARHWVGDFVNHLARTQAQRSPNAGMQVQVQVADPDPLDA